MITTLTRACVTALTLAAASAALAQSNSDPLRLDVVPTQPFAKGTKVLQAWGSYTPPFQHSDDEFSTASVGVGYYLFDNHALSIVGHGFHTSHDADGGGVSFLGRSHLFTADPFTFYIDGGVGYYWADQAVPDGGTTYNFASRAGLGAGFRLADHTWLTAGARYFHLSNAQQHGKEKNPGYNGIEYYVGILWTWR